MHLTDHGQRHLRPGRIPAPRRALNPELVPRVTLRSTLPHEPRTEAPGCAWAGSRCAS